MLVFVEKLGHEGCNMRVRQRYVAFQSLIIVEETGYCKTFLQNPNLSNVNGVNAFIKTAYYFLLQFVLYFKPKHVGFSLIKMEAKQKLLV